jgi:hypothetical protein
MAAVRVDSATYDVARRVIFTRSVEDVSSSVDWR